MRSFVDGVEGAYDLTTHSAREDGRVLVTTVDASAWAVLGHKPGHAHVIVDELEAIAMERKRLFVSDAEVAKG